MASSKRCPRGLEVQTLLFPRESWTPSRAKAWARSQRFQSGKVDITTSYIRVRNRDPRDFTPGTFRTITLSEVGGVKAVVGCPKRSRESDKGKSRRSRDVARYDLSPAGKAWMRVYQEEGATPETRDSFERLSRFDQAAIRFLLTESR